MIRYFYNLEDRFFYASTERTNAFERWVLEVASLVTGMLGDFFSRLTPRRRTRGTRAPKMSHQTR